MKRFISIITTMVIVMTQFTMPFASAADTTREYGIYTRAEIADAKARIADTSDTATAAAYEQFQIAVDWALTEEPSSVETLKIPGSYYDGTNHSTYRKLITNDAYAAYTLSLAWQLTGKDDYAAKAVAFLKEWATVNKSIPYDDKNDSDDKETGGYFDNPLVSAYGGVGFIYAAELLSGYNGWAEDDQTAFKTWVKNIYEPAVYACISRNFNNNWTSWGLLASIASNYYIGNDTKVESLKNLLKAQINIQINNRGQMWAEINRGANGMWYTYFSLAPLTQAIQYVYNITGGEENYFYFTGVNGGSVTKALNHLLPYVEDTASWESDYSVTLGLKPVLNTTGRCWPLNLYEAMRYIYGEYDENEAGARYADLADKYDPIPGGAITYSSSMNMHHIVWSFPSLMIPTQLITSSVSAGTAYPEYLTDDFEDYGSTGSLDGSIKWREDKYPDANGNTNGISATVAADPTDSSNNALKLYDTLSGTYNSSTGTGQGCVEVIGTTQPQFGLSSTSFKFMFAGTSGGSYNSGVHISGMESDGDYSPAASLLYTAKGLILRIPQEGKSVDIPVLDSVEFNHWYDIKFVFNPEMQTFDLYIDGELEEDDFAFRYKVDNIARIKFSTDSPSNNTVNYIDDVFIGQLDHIEDDAENYSSDNWATYIGVDGTITPKPSEQNLETGVTTDPDDPNNQVIYLKDNNSPYCVEQHADMRPKQGLCYVTLDMKYAGTKSDWSGFHIQDYTTSESFGIASLMYDPNNGIILRGVDTSGQRSSDENFTVVPKSGANAWHNFKFVINTYTQTYDVYVDNELVKAGVDFRSADATKLSRVKLTSNGGTSGTLNYYDNIYAGELNYEVIDAKVTETGLTAKVLHDDYAADIYIATYDSTTGCLLSVDVLDTADSNMTKLADVKGTLSRVGDTYKVFIFDDGGIVPLCNAFTKTK